MSGAHRPDRPATSTPQAATSAGDEVANATLGTQSEIEADRPSAKHRSEETDRSFGRARRGI